MKIETKFDVNDSIWTLDGQGIVDGRISKIELIKYGKEYNKSMDWKIEVSYDIKMSKRSSTLTRRENEMYLSKQEVGEAWMKKQGLEIGLKES